MTVMSGGVGDDSGRARIETLAMAALEALPEASVMVFDTDLRYVIVRGQALALHGFARDHFEGRPVAEALGPQRWALYEPLYRAALEGETGSMEIASPDEKLWYLVQVGPLRDVNGGVIGGVSFAADVTARKRADEHVESLLDFAPDAIVVVAGDGTIVRVNAQTEVLFGYQRGELLGQPVETLVPVRFRGGHVGLRDSFLCEPHARPMGLGFDLAGLHRDGREFPVEISLGPLETDAGVVVSAAIRDVTDRLRVERDAAHLAAVVESSHDAIVGKDLDGIVTSWNLGAERLYGYTEAEMRGKSISALVPAGHSDDLPEILRRVRSGERIEEYETVRARKDGTDVEVSVTLSPMRSPNGTLIGLSSISRGITERLRYQEQLRFLADHDSLTGIRNRRGFERDLAEQIGRAQRYGERAALLIFDVDGLKQINDTNSHQAGDLALTGMAAALGRRLRDTDVVARIGGDEFAVLLPYTDENQAAVIIEDLRLVIREVKVPLASGTSLSLAASCGVALINQDTTDADSVLSAADRAMYADKSPSSRRS